jgi:prevent-host-death family protein
MTAKWQMQEAKAKFGELVKKATTEGPQTVTYRGVDTAVVLSVEDYKRMLPARKTFIEHILDGPKWDDEFVDLINERSKDTGRDIDL